MDWMAWVGIAQFLFWGTVAYLIVTYLTRGKK